MRSSVTNVNQATPFHTFLTHFFRSTSVVHFYQLLGRTGSLFHLLISSKIWTYLASLLRISHAPPIPSFLISSFCQYFVISTNAEDPQCVIFSSFLLLAASYIHISYPVPCSPKTSLCVLHFLQDDKFSVPYRRISSLALTAHIIDSEISIFLINK